MTNFLCVAMCYYASLYYALQSSKYITDKRLRIDIGALKEILLNKEIESITWIKSSPQIVDSLTKHVANSLPLIRCYKKVIFR